MPDVRNLPANPETDLLVYNFIAWIFHPVYFYAFCGAAVLVIKVFRAFIGNVGSDAGFVQGRLKTLTRAAYYGTCPLQLGEFLPYLV